MTTTLIALSAAFGAVARYRIGLLVGVRDFPWATLVVNVTGCLALGLLLGASTTGRWRPELTLAVGVGFLGAYTTFSTFGYETFILLRLGRVTTAALYAGASLALGLCGTAAGYAVGKSLA